MENKHTPGNWSYQGPKISDVAEGQTYFTINSDCGEIRGKGYLFPGFFYPYSLQTPEEMEANAKLVAAAPDMLNALIALKGVMPFHDGEYTEGESIAMVKLEKAIRKATKG